MGQPPIRRPIPPIRLTRETGSQIRKKTSAAVMATAAILAASIHANPWGPGSVSLQDCSSPPAAATLERAACTRSSTPACAAPPCCCAEASWSGSPEVGVDHIDELLRTTSPLLIGVPGGVRNMNPNVVLHE